MKFRNIVLILLLAITFEVNAQQPTLLPQFTFYKLDGKPFSNADIKQGKKNLFMFFDCTCEHCQRESKSLNANYAKFKDVNIYMITMDEAYIIPQFFNSYAKGLNAKPNVLVLQDKKRIFIPTFLPVKYPAMYLYSPAGKLLMYQSGDGGIKKMMTLVSK